MPKILNTRMSGWLYVSLLLLLIIGLLAPQQLPLSLYKLSLITTGAWVGYWIDRSLFPYARPAVFTACAHNKDNGRRVIADYQLAYAAAMLRRALIIAAAMLGVAFGA